jgi:hypothetical protein
MGTILICVGLVVVAWLAHRAKKLGYFDKKDDAGAGVVLDQGLPFPCVIEGSIDAPPMADQLRALDIEAASKGITITGDYEADKAAQGGGMFLLGYTFKFTFDAAGQVVLSDSHANLFGVNYPVSGGMEATGVLGMDIVVDTARVQIQGKVVNGKFVDGKAVKSWLPHIYGVLHGTYRKS